MQGAQEVLRDDSEVRALRRALFTHSWEHEKSMVVFFESLDHHFIQSY